jgi:hypothetical protein
VTMPTTPTLHPARRERLRTFLVDEARLTAAEAPAARHAPARRTVLAAGVALAVAGGALALGTTGGDGPAPEVVAVVAITEEDGWVTISLRDPGATADSIVAELQAAGIASRVEVVPECPPEGSGLPYPTICGRGMQPGIAGLMPEPGPSIPPVDPRDPGPFEDQLEAVGVRMNDDGSISFRQGYDVVIVVYEVE